MRGFTPIRWLWGLVPLFLIAVLVVAGEMPRIERDLVTRSAVALEASGYPWARLQFHGQDGVLTGTASSPEERAEALEVVSGVWGVRSVQDRAELVEVVSPYTWIASRKGNRLRVKGHVPSKADRKTMLGIVKATMPELEIDDRTKLARGAPPRQKWLAAVTFALNQLAQLEDGNVRLSNLEFVLVGEAGSLAKFKAVKNAMATEMPSWLTPKHVALAPPGMNPFNWTVQRTGSRVILGGHVTSEDARQLILKHVDKAFGEAMVVDRMVLGSGAPRNWMKAVQLALNLLARLEEGQVALSDYHITLDGVAADTETAEAVAGEMRETLPEDFRSVENVRVRKGASRVEHPDPSPRLTPIRKLARAADFGFTPDVWAYPGTPG